jgi:hypothetical protein
MSTLFIGIAPVTLIDELDRRSSRDPYRIRAASSSAFLTAAAARRAIVRFFPTGVNEIFRPV